MPAPAEPSSPPTSRKRKQSATDARIGRAIKYRSSQACQSCRARKVRCDVTTNGSCCTNCRLDHTECVVVASRRGKTNRARRKSNSEGEPRAAAESKASPNSSPNVVARRDPWPGYATVDTPVASGDAGHVPACVTFDEDLDKPSGDQQPAVHDAGTNGTDVASSKVYEDLLSPETGTGTSTLNQYHSPVKKTLLPAFIAPFSGRITNDDWNFLVLKGATTIPDHDLRMEILRGYLFSIHPFMPMLDFRAFIRAVLDTREEGQISLLLFQAVMFAGLNSLRSHIIHRLGFNSVKQAREVFYDRVKLLYEFDVETDNATVLQAILLMSFWYGKSDDRRHTWHWTGVAYDVARSMGLQREPTARQASDKVRRFRRRLWWSLYIRDRMIALGTRRPMRIRDDEFNVGMLTVEDLDIEPLEESHMGQPLIPSVEETTSTALMCVQLTKLCVCIGHVVSSQYTVLNNQPDIPYTMMVVSKRDGGDTRELEMCEKELKEWFDTLGSNVRRTGSSTPQQGRHSCSEVHWEILNLTYLTVVNVLHRAKALQPLAESAEGQALQKSSRAKVKDAARGLTRVSQTMLCNDHVRYLSPLGVTALNAACLSHMLDISSGDADVRDASTFRLYQSLQVLQSLRGIYASADASLSFLTSITQKAGIPIPAQVAAPSGDFATPSADSVGKPADEKFIDGKHSVESPDARWPLLSERSNAVHERFPANSFRGISQSSDGHMQTQTLLDMDGQALNAGDVMQTGTRAGPTSPSPVTFTTPRSTSASRQGLGDTETNTPTAEKRTGLYFDANFGATNQAADGALFEWNNSVDASMDLDTMAFSYDFYANAFGFFDGEPQRL